MKHTLNVGESVLRSIAVAVGLFCIAIVLTDCGAGSGQANDLNTSTGTTATSPTIGDALFTGLQNLEFVANDCSSGTGYYDGCTGSLGSGPGTNLGLEFTPNAQAIISAAHGGAGNFTGNPSNHPVMFFHTDDHVAVTFRKGVALGLWFYYSALQNGQATVYDGPSGTGNILTSVSLNPNDSGCDTYKMCVWTPVGVPLSAMANSIQFSGTADDLGIGDLHLGKPLPSTTTVTTTQDPGQPCGAAVFTATVSGIGGVVPADTQDGKITFRAGTTVVASAVPLVSGAASVTESLPSGTTITAVFKPTLSFAGSQGSMVLTCQ